MISIEDWIAIVERTHRENTVASTNSKHYDERYLYDFVHRLKSLERGNINTTTQSISNINYEETWSLDETGNWREYQQDTDGDGTWNLIQSRTSNKVNEITNITETVGTAWVTPSYNKSGNMVTLPTPNNPTTSYTATYDAWNRLVKLEDDTNTITEYQYDGTRRRILHKVYNTGVLDHTKHLYYNANWQLLEERRDTNTTPTKQQIWGNRYIDDLVIRDHDTNNNGTLNERLYALQDANWNVTSYVNESGTVQERYIYNAYGDVTFLDSNFGVRTSSTIEPDHLYAGYNYDAGIEMYHVRNRVYHPILGCWLQRDPIGYDGGINLYEYVKSNSLYATDSTGLIAWPVVVIGVIVIGGALVWIFSETNTPEGNCDPCECDDLCDFGNRLVKAGLIVRKLVDNCDSGREIGVITHVDDYGNIEDMQALNDYLQSKNIHTVGEYTWGVLEQGEVYGFL